jgi:hypothetical protein
MTSLYDKYYPFFESLTNQISQQPLMVCKDNIDESIYLYCIEEMDIVLRFKIQLFSLEESKYVEMKYIEGNIDLYNNIHTLFQKY